MEIKLRKTLYPIEAIRNTIYWFSKDLMILLDDKDDFYYINSDDFTTSIKRKFLKSLNDHVLREQINSESKDIKNLIISKAFYPDLVQFKNIGEFDDPINMLKKSGD